MDHDTDSQYYAQAGSAVMAFPHKNDPCRKTCGGVIFAVGFSFFVMPPAASGGKARSPRRKVTDI